MSIAQVPRRGARALGASLTALALALVPAAAAAQTTEAPESRGIDRVCPPPDAPPITVPFPDALDSNHHEAIECAAGYDLVSGYPDGTYRPSEAITRAQMATFIVNWIETATGEELTYGDDDPDFPDVGEGTHSEAIRKLAAAGVVGGRTDGTYGPGDDVNRGQMARFVANAVDYVDNGTVDGSLPPADATEYFADAVGTTFQADIQRIAGVGIAAGDTDGNYNPRDPVTRGQMATFVMRAADYADEEGHWLPTADEGDNGEEEDDDEEDGGLLDPPGDDLIPPPGLPDLSL